MDKIIHGDCIAKLKDIESESVDLIIADPPYNLGKDYGNDSDKQNFKAYIKFSKEWIGECYRVLKKQEQFIYS